MAKIQGMPTLTADQWNGIIDALAAAESAGELNADGRSGRDTLREYLWESDYRDRSED